MASEEAACIIDLYQRKALDWIESRARTRLFEKSWLDRFRALGLEQVDLLGFSIGGYQVEEVALRHPSWCASSSCSAPASEEGTRRVTPRCLTTH